MHLLISYRKITAPPRHIVFNPLFKLHPIAPKPNPCILGFAHTHCVEAMPPSFHPPETGVKMATSQPGSSGVEAATYS